jgi:hypothetical protein
LPHRSVRMSCTSWVPRSTHSTCSGDCGRTCHLLTPTKQPGLPGAVPGTGRQLPWGCPHLLLGSVLGDEEAGLQLV